MIISIDTECGGLDWAHGAMPFLVTTCSDDGTVRFWEWDVDPLTRKPNVLTEDVVEIVELLDTTDLIYAQNAKYDAHMLLTIGIQLPWEKVRDTLIMGHLLASNHRHDLTWMCIAYLGADIEPHERAVKEVTQACRAIAKRDYPEWRLAEEGLPEMPSVKGSSKRDEDKPWKNDMWLPRALVAQWDIEGHPIDDDRWLTACSRYANADSEHTLPLGLEMERLIRERGLWRIYEDRMHLPRIACDMECYGVTAIGAYTEATITDYELHVAEVSSELVWIANEYGHDLELAEGASINDNMRSFFYGSVHQACPRCKYERRVKHWAGESADEDGVCPKCAGRKKAPMRHRLVTTRADNLKLPVVGYKKSGGACLDKDVMKDYLTTTEGVTYDFVKLLTDKRKHDTDLTYMHAYRRFWVPVQGFSGFYRVHPSLNPCATDHLRWASNSPNMQNVGGQEDQCDECDGSGCAWCNHTGKTRISVRNCFGPAPDREWWTMDYKSIEARIPAYESGERKMIEVFEKPNEAPYWGNLYNLTASVLYPKEYWPLAQIEGEFRKRHPRLYKRAKFFVLAKNYGAGRRKGDLLSGVRGSYDLVDNEFPLLAKLQQHYLSYAEKYGYVETLPDKDVDPKRGYPILASRTDDGRVLSTTPFNYHISGTACWCKNRALIRCAAQLEEWRRGGFDGHIALEIHDEILFDFPRGTTVVENLFRALELKRLMELSGVGIGIPTPCSAEYHDTSWAIGWAIGVAA